MARSERRWRASNLVVPSGSDIGGIHRILTAPEDSPLVISQVAIHTAGQTLSPSIASHFFLVPPGLMVGSTYTIAADEPVYGVGTSASTNIETGDQNNPLLYYAPFGVKASNLGPQFVVPAGWAFGVEVSATTNQDIYYQVMGVVNAA